MVSSKEKNNLIIGEHFKEIDILRAFAILGVMFWHASEYSMFSVSKLDIYSEIYFCVSLVGALGVNLFFVISGFLITGILIDTRTEKGFLKKFYIRRALRIFPLYYLGLLISIAFAYVYVWEYKLNNYLPFYFFYFQNWIFFTTANGIEFIDHSDFFAPLWSLAVEEQYYLFWPLCLIVLLKKADSKKFLFVALIIMLSSVFLCSWLTFFYSWYIPYTWTVTRLSGLILGSLLAFLSKTNNEIIDKIINYRTPVCSILFVLIFFELFLGLITNHLYEYYVRYTLFTADIICFFLVAAASKNQFKNPIKILLSNAFLSETAKISYGLYIYHGIVFCAIYYNLKNMGISFWLYNIIFLTAGVGISYFLAHFSYYYFEKPITEFKYKLAPYDKESVRK